MATVPDVNFSPHIIHHSAFLEAALTQNLGFTLSLWPCSAKGRYKQDNLQRPKEPKKEERSPTSLA